MMDNQVSSYTELTKIMTTIDDGLKAASLTVIDADLFQLDQLVDLVKSEGLVALAATIKAPVFKTVTVADKAKSYFTLDDVEDALSLRGINSVPDHIADQLDAYLDNIKQVHWGGPVQIVYHVINGEIDYRYMAYIQDAIMLEDDVNAFVAQFVNDHDLIEASNGYDQSVNQQETRPLDTLGFSDLPIAQQTKADKLVDQFVNKVKDDPRFAMTVNEQERQKFIRTVVDEDTTVKDIYKKIRQLVSFNGEVLRIISSSLLTEYRKHKKHYDAIRKAQEQ